MESPPSFSTLSEAPAISEDSGLLITSGSFSSDSASGWHHIASETVNQKVIQERGSCPAIEELNLKKLNVPNTIELQESDFDEPSLSLCESTETSERMCGDFFNTVKKGPTKVVLPTIEPPLEFQDNPQVNIEICLSERIPTPTGVVCNTIVDKQKSVGLDNLTSSNSLSPRKLKLEAVYERRQCLNRFASPRLLHVSPGRGARPSSRSSLSSRLSSSHNSLVTQFQADDSSFITQAISHDTLSAKTSDITDMYNVPFDSDIYAVPVDVIRPSQTGSKGKKVGRNNKKRGKSTSQNFGMNHLPNERTKQKDNKKEQKSKRHSLPSSSGKKSCTDSDTESMHLTLREMRKFLHTLYSSSSDSECKGTMINEKSNGVLSVSIHARHTNNISNDAIASNALFLTESPELPRPAETNNNHRKSNKNSFGINTKSKKHKESSSKEADVEKNDKALKKAPSGQSQKAKVSTVRILSLNLKQSFCNLFRWRRQSEENGAEAERSGRQLPAAVRRALPPLPLGARGHSSRRPANAEEVPDFASSIQKVKDYGWYWGPITVDAAEKILSNEPDGSFIVRDSSDDHYIFTLTFKLNGLRHVRIEHDQGNFCFGGCTMFKAATIVEFIENAVETSRSGRYLFFLNLRPVLGPVRVQLLYPVSRFKRVQSLQHMCRFVILKNVRRDLIPSLPLPRRLLDYLNATHYYSEMLAEI